MGSEYTGLLGFERRAEKTSRLGSGAADLGAAGDPLGAFGDVRSGGRGHAVPAVRLHRVRTDSCFAVPVLIVAEGVIWPRVVDLFHYLVRSGVVAEGGVPALERLIRRFDALRRSWIMACRFNLLRVVSFGYQVPV